MAKKKLDLNDLDKTLRDFGFKEGDELLLPSEKEANESTTEGGESEGGEGDGEDGGNGSNNPGKKPPFTPEP